MSRNSGNDEIFTRRGNMDRSRDRSNDNRGRDRSPLTRASKQGREDCRVFVSNLPYEYRWQDVKALFRREVGDVGFVELFTDENDKSKGSGIVEFETPENAKKAIDKLHRFDVEGRKIVVKEDYGAPRDKYGNLLRNRGDGRNDDKNNRGGMSNRDVGPMNNRNQEWGDTYGLSRPFLDGLNIIPPLGCRVFIANLDYKVTEKKLREVFKLAGKVREVELHTDAEGKSRGFAVVEYDHPVESVQAISMLHNQQLYDRRITVRLDRDTKESGGRLPEGLHSIGMGLGQNGAPLKDVARNLPNANPSAQSNSLQPIAPQNSLSALTAAAALSNPLTAAAIGGLTPSAAALQAAAMLAPGNAGLLSSSALNSLAASRNDSMSRDLPFASLAGLGSSNLLNDSNNSVTMHSLGSTRDSFNDRGNSPARNNSVPKSSDTVIVDNLPHNYTWQELKEQFRDAGDIKFAEMRGKLGLVRFASDWEALRAVSLLDRTRIDGQMIDVRLF